MDINVFTIDMKLRRVRNSILKILIFYFMAIALATFSYISPTSIFSYEMVIVGVLLVMGITLFFVGIEAIQRIANSRVEYELDLLNKKLKDQLQTLENIASEGHDNGMKEKINITFGMSEVQQREYDSLMQVKIGYDRDTIGIFICSFLIPMMTLAITLLVKLSINNI